jgi:hypothetical protein
MKLSQVVDALSNGAVLHLSLADKPTWKLMINGVPAPWARTYTSTNATSMAAAAMSSRCSSARHRLSNPRRRSLARAGGAFYFGAMSWR